ncbi:MAG: ABC transporter permease [Oscillatoriales cyanobacterium]|uniref:ABC transporter permease n=1 Tax=Microcoleus anatoxicus PTRS2 TaxID=2705321 RepID=A0ABU8YG44_9CYAN|nr:MAG: ABC transporter permease [Oscillatoriales cyanobacterium]TAD95536.1 MAG: ABC transporter permease [Oscillatoriales cyanobacterium]TAE01056.1 MAG: ABC transporter permease [Oscillatoriales cyanobacterium]TAF04489.1 MAG: ABC transporter permease [Oscillatoriales cyanobacterium]TAF64049.1 MAG: ABC transporter permease [Oscillatoriales cyanobacterium]
MTKLDLRVRAIGKKWLWIQATLAFAFLYLPILILIIYSFNSSKFNAIWRGFTLDWYRSLFSDVRTLGIASSSSAGIWTALNNSLLIATISTLLATVLGTAIALALERFHFPGRKAVETLLFLPIVMPEITIGISLLVFFTLVFRILENLTGIRLNLGLPTVIIGHVTFNISFVTITVRARLAELDPILEQAAFDLGANEWRTFWRITLPLIWPSVFSGALLAFTLSLDDFVVTFFTTGVGSMTLPLFVYGMIKFAVTPAINALSTLMLLASLLLVLSSLRMKKS